MSRVRLGAVGYLNARPLVWGLENSPRFEVRFDVPSRCADLLHSGGIDVGLIPSIEYLRGDEYRAVPDVAIASDGTVGSVLLFTRKEPADIRSIALDTSSRTSVALVRILCDRWFKIAPALEPQGPDLDAMLSRFDAALLIGDNALFAPRNPLQRSVCDEDSRSTAALEAIDLGEVWTAMTGLPFVWAFWAGRKTALAPADSEALARARDQGVTSFDEIARRYCPKSPARQQKAAAYLRDNIKYEFGPDGRAAVDLFYRYAHEAQLVPEPLALQMYEGP